MTPTTIKKAMNVMLTREVELKKESADTEASVLINSVNLLIPSERKKLIKMLEQQMVEYANMLQYEEAARIRDKINEIKKMGD